MKGEDDIINSCCEEIERVGDGEVSGYIEKTLRGRLDEEMLWDGSIEVCNGDIGRDERPFLSSPFVFRSILEYLIPSHGNRTLGGSGRVLVVEGMSVKQMVLSS